MNRPLRIIASILILMATAGSASGQPIENRFRTWLETDLWPEARKGGISRDTFDAAFEGVRPNLKLPDLVLPGRQGGPQAQHQAEFGAPANYFAHISGVTSGGRARAERYADTLAAIERHTAVPGGIVLAIWGRESGFGGAKIPHDAFEVLGTKAFLATRKDMFRREVLAALAMMQLHGIKRDAMRSSWAGALGQPQFMPTSFVRYAVDGDGDGRRDIWNSVPDTLWSIANYLIAHGWVKGRDWGFEVTVPDTISCALEGPDRGRRIADWVAMGVKRVNGRPFPDHELRQEGFLLMPAGRNGPAFIATPNFYVLKEYNESDLYALFVGHAADRIIYGDRGFAASWDRVDRLLRSDIAAMQRALEASGYDVGGADGLPGFRTRRSIGGWQGENGMAPTCFPTVELVRTIR